MRGVLSSSSSCSIDYDPYGRQGIGVTQPQSGTDFPLVGVPSDDIRYLLADMSLSYDDPFDYGETDSPFVGPFRIYWLYGVGCQESDGNSFTPEPVNEAEIIVVDDNDCVVFDSTEASKFVSRAWGDRLHVYMWETTDAILSIVVHTKWGDTADPGMEPRKYDTNIFPENAVIDERSIERRPKRVKSVQVVLDNYTKLGLDFVEGFNMEINPAGEVIRGNKLFNRIEMRATPGAGLGIFPGCDPTPLVIRKINNVPPTTAGDFFMSANECYYVRQPSVIESDGSYVTAATLQFGNDCVPCCGCEDYVATGEYMNRTRDKWAALGSDAESVRDQYHANRDRWYDSKCCFERHPLRLVFQPQLCPFLDVALQFCNDEADCVGPLQLNVEFEEIDGFAGSSASTSLVPEIVPGFTYIKGASAQPYRRGGAVERYTMGGAWPNFTAYWDGVDPKQSVWVRFRLKFPGCGEKVSGGPLVVSATLTGEIDGVPIEVPFCDGPVGEDYEPTSFNVAEETKQTVLRCPPSESDIFDYSECIADYT